MSTHSEEGKKRDAALKRVKANPNNNYEMIAIHARRWIIKKPIGWKLSSHEVYKAVMEIDPSLQPSEKRVMGPVMRRMVVEGLIEPAGISTRGRSHQGFTREWKRIPV